jgi:8-oxo-dGTP diphosphatase
MNEVKEQDSRWYPQSPMVGVHPLVIKDGHLLLVKRAKEPSKGKWSLPGGRIELGESVYEAGRREVFEECSIEIEIERLLDVADMILKDDDGRISYHFVLIYLLARYKTGDIKAQSDAAGIGWFTPAEINGLDMHPKLRAVLARAGLS